jgi:hypothetical protein
VPAENLFDRLFDDFTDEAFRLETLPGYNVGGDADRLTQYRSGAYLPEPPVPGVDFVHDMVRPPRRTTLVRLISDPLTIDQRLSIDWVYPHHAAAGREISILEPGSKVASQAADVGDFWLFDSKAVALMRYAADGGFEGEEIITGDDQLRPFLDLREQLLSAATPFRAWLASWREKSR